MALKVWTLLLIGTLSANAISADKTGSDVGTLAIEFGEQIEQALRDLFAGFKAPIVIIPPETPIPPINLTQLAEQLAGEGMNLPFRGMLTITGPLELAGINETEPSARVTLNGIVQPIVLYVLLNVPNVRLEANYDLDALLLGVIPVRGKGLLSLGLGIGLGIDGRFKVKLGSGDGGFSTFEYLFDLQRIEANFEGLLGGPELSKEVNRIINEFLNNTLTLFLRKTEATLHRIVSGVFKDTINVLPDVKGLTYAKILELLEGIGGGDDVLTLAIKDTLKRLPEVQELASARNLQVLQSGLRSRPTFVY